MVLEDGREPQDVLDLGRGVTPLDRLAEGGEELRVAGEAGVGGAAGDLVADPLDQASRPGQPPCDRPSAR